MYSWNNKNHSDIILSVSCIIIVCYSSCGSKIIVSHGWRANNNPLDECLSVSSWALGWAESSGRNTRTSTLAVQTEVGPDLLARVRWKRPRTPRECERLSDAGHLGDTPHWGFFTSNAAWRWGAPGSARGERGTCECVKTGEEDNRFTLCNSANDEWVTTASFPAWHSDSVDKRETFTPSILLKQQKPSAKQNIVFPRFLSELCQFLFFIAPDSAPIFDKGCKSTKIADVSNLSEFSPFDRSTSIKVNPPSSSLKD